MKSVLPEVLTTAVKLILFHFCLNLKDSSAENVSCVEVLYISVTDTVSLFPPLLEM